MFRVIRFIYPFQIAVNEVIPVQVLQTNSCVNELQKVMLTLKTTSQALVNSQVGTGFDRGYAQ